MSSTKTSSFGTVSRAGHNSDAFYQRKIYSKTKKPSQENTQDSQIEFPSNVIHHHDSRHMEQLPDNSVHLMITSPPYNVGKDYDQDLSLDEYKDLLHQVLAETYRVLAEGGRACINIANVGRKPYIPLHGYLIEIAEKVGFFMRGEIIWDKGASAGSSCAWGSWKSASNPVLRDVHEYILIFCKGAFRRHSTKPSSISRDDFLENTKSIWRFPSCSAKKFKHAAPFPVELPSRLIHLYSFEDDIVLDPFMGSGTTAVASVELGRRYVGYEINETYVEIATERLSCVQGRNSDEKNQQHTAQHDSIDGKR